MPAQIKIKVGAALDRSVNEVFAQVEARAHKVRTSITKEFAKPFFPKGIESEADRSWNRVVDSASRANRKIRKEGEQTSRELGNAFKQIAKVAESELNRSARAERRARDAFAARTSYRSIRNMVGMGHSAARLGNDILRGAGVDFSVQGSVSRAVQTQSAAIGIAQQERIATNGSTRGAAYYESFARKKSEELSVDPAKLIGMFRSFTGKTGDFGAAEKLTAPLASLGVASDTDLTQMGDAAGFVYNQLKNLPDAGQRVIAVMRGIVGQTAVGSVEMKDYATQMGRIAANANKFEGSVDKNIMKLSALAQLSIESGGASSAADAARSVGSFANTFGKTARISAFKKAHVQLFTDDKQDTLRDPFEIVKDSFRNTKGNIPQLADMFADTLGRKPVTALGQAYKGAGGGEEGIKAVEAQLGRYMNAQISEKVEKENVADYLKSDAARAQKFQNNLDKIVSSLAERVLPQLEKLAPVALDLAENFGKLVGAAVENPGMTILAAIVASIGQAGIGAALRTHIDRTFMGGAGAGGIGGSEPRRLYSGTGTNAANGATWSGALGAVGAGAAIGIPIAAAMYTSGISGFDSNSKGLADITKGLSGTYGSDLGVGLAMAKANLKKMEDDEYGGPLGLWGHAKDLLGMGSEAEFKGAHDIIDRKGAEYDRFRSTGQLPPGAAEAMAGKQQKIQAEIDPSVIARGMADGMSSRTMNVRVTNPKDIGGTPAPPAGNPHGGTDH